MKRQFDIYIGNSPIIATAIHSGHMVSSEVANRLKLNENDRLREEDHYTSGWTEISDSRLVCYMSRFELDLNRSRNEALYLTPENAWGLQVWEQQPTVSIVDNSNKQYEKFYHEVEKMLKQIEIRFGSFVVLDLHSYNHLRNGPDTLPADSCDNPEINIGTESITKTKWRPIIDRFISDLRDFNYLGRHLDVRENIKFKGGNFPRWINSKFGKNGCAIAVEVKKIFMNEWTGELYIREYNTIKAALASTIPGLKEELNSVKNN